MIDYKIVLGIAATIIGFIGYIPYFRGIFKGQTKPHIFSWLGWGLMEAAAFFAQISAGAGFGAWVVGFSSLTCFIVVILAFFKGEKSITLFDWLAFGGVIIGLVLWKLTNNPLAAIILICITDALAFAPTFRKAYYKPGEEKMISFFLASVRSAISLAAMGSLNLTTALYPLSLIITNSTFVSMLYVRRNKIHKK
jgi:hypothetical protein